jgi:cytochrome P450
MVVNETMRVRPTVPTIGRKAIADSIIGGVYVPKDVRRTRSE